MSVESLATLEELRRHFSREDYVTTLLGCANKRTDTATLRIIYERFFAPDATIRKSEGKKGLEIADLGQIMQYKLSRGKWRPRLQQLVESNDEEDVARITASAIGNSLSGSSEVLSLEEVKHKMDELCKLKAVGPATASLVLGIFYASVPFFSDEFAAFYPSVGGDKLKYTLKEYLSLVEAHRSWLISQQLDQDSVSAQTSSSREVEEMIWYWTRSPPSHERKDEVKPQTSRKRSPEETGALPKRSKASRR